MFIKLLSELPIAEKEFVVEVIKEDEKVIKQWNLWHAKDFKGHKATNNMNITPKEINLGLFVHRIEVVKNMKPFIIYDMSVNIHISIDTLKNINIRNYITDDKVILLVILEFVKEDVDK